MNRYFWVIAILLALVVFSPDAGQSRAIGAAHDFAHAPVFGIVTLLLLLWQRPSRRSLAMQYSIAIGVSTLLGLATEIAQYYSGRDAAWIDLRSDVLGTLAFAGLFAAFDARLSMNRWRYGLCIAGAIAMLWHCLPLLKTAQAYVHRGQVFPALLDATDDLPDTFALGVGAAVTESVLPAQFAHVSQERTLEIEFREGTWPGVQLLEPVADWQGYRTLAIDVTNPGEPMSINLRVHDRLHNNAYDDRFNREFFLPGQMRTILRIPLQEIRDAPRQRILDLEQIDGLAVFTSRVFLGRQIYLSRIWLEPGE